MDGACIKWVRPRSELEKTEAGGGEGEDGGGGGGGASTEDAGTGAYGEVLAQNGGEGGGDGEGGAGSEGGAGGDGDGSDKLDAGPDSVLYPVIA